MSDFLRRFAEGFAALDKHNLDRLGELYSDDIQFRDPLHRIEGLAALHRYFEQLYGNVTELHFDFHGHDLVAEGEGYLRWSMRYRHPRLAAGQPITLPGCSHLRWHSDKVYQHRDYFDAGHLLYEHLPLFGVLIRWLKGRLA
ncbi:nuclear transport factor 2 family protein [Phytopseudomonas dryadis]|uniref:Transcriptional regulator n=1 Tax=Phytopseudomonas dryadis TaxID=2487520 RepID=A0A4Q9R9A0_9GAMM|nr:MULTISPECIES: nuclear transport factor 2 family protein [Pseudomonas]TBU96323.1 transcriptional regulator [Pseudomonas dryadis]TBU99536.1 transcriptional regulator [Pseudomonas dryadis]TBV14772.1 transcriptional regulator [Pseudomonas sp. FRB 230]